MGANGNFSIEQIEKLIKAQAGVPMLLAVPGAGKSAIAQAIADKNGWQFFDLRLAQMDQSEVTGLYDRKDNYVVLRPQEWAIHANEKPSLVFFDELNRAGREVRNAALQIFSERKLGSSFSFNENVYFLAAGNLGEADNTDVEEFDDALKNRLIPIEINAGHASWIDQWLAWATSEKGQVHETITTFIKKYPQYLFAREQIKEGNDSKSFATARSWTFFSRLLTRNNVKATLDVLDYARTFSSLYIGGGTSLKYISYLEEANRINWSDIVQNWDKVKDTVKDMPRDKISEILFDLKEQNICAFTAKETQNIISFCKVIDPDEVAGYIFGLAEHSFDPTNKADMSNLKAFLKEFKSIAEKLKEEPPEEVKKEEKKEEDTDFSSPTLQSKPKAKKKP